LAVLATKMDIIVGADGTGGAIHDLGDRVSELEQQRDINAGRSQISGKVIALCGGLAGSIVTAILTTFLHAVGIR